MLKAEIENRLTTILVLGGVVVTLLVTDRISADPVNVGKMTALAMLAGACLGILISSKKNLLRESRALSIALFSFVSVSFVSVWLSSNSWERGLYGAYGRNTGFLTYISLTIIFFALAQLRDTKNHLRMFRAFLFVGSVNLIYCVFAAQGFEIFTWNNPYDKVLGTFGNPNFISSFMGFFISGLTAIFLIPRTSWRQRSLVTAIIAGSFYVIWQTSSIQGIVVAVGGVAVVLYFSMRAKFNSTLMNTIYLTSALSLGLVSILGMLQKGPLAGILYKPSVSYRGEYWEAGSRMGWENPLFGVGLDSYGTFYRAFRGESAIVSPGIDTITDTAHNVFIDVFAGTGFFGLTSYLFIQIIVVVSSLKFIRKNKSYDVIFVFLFSTWLVYQAQTIISINQVGIAFWGWALGGCLYSYTRLAPVIENEKTRISFGDFSTLKKNFKSAEVPASTALGSFLGAAIFLAIALPSFYADVNLRNAVRSNDAQRILQVGLQFPADSNRLNFLSYKLSEGGITEQSVTLVKLGHSKFPNDYGLLLSMFKLSPADSAESKFYGKKLHLADPFNPLYLDYK